jgi:hypothetical protein
MLGATVAAPDDAVVRGSHGYHPVSTDLEVILRSGGFDQLLVFGESVPDVVEHVREIRVVVRPPVDLPRGVYWFSGVEPSGVLWVTAGGAAGPSIAAAFLRVRPWIMPWAGWISHGPGPGWFRGRSFLPGMT